MKIVIPGCTGQVGLILNRALTAAGHGVVTLTRHPTRERQTHWDGETPGPWTVEIDGSDVVINLASRSVNRRYTEANRNDMMDSRVGSARPEPSARRSRPHPGRRDSGSR